MTYTASPIKPETREFQLYGSCDSTGASATVDVVDDVDRFHGVLEVRFTDDSGMIMGTAQSERLLFQPGETIEIDLPCRTT